MKHIYRNGTNPTKPVLFLLHGTGGNENDLIPIANIVDPECSVLSVRGNVLENGMPRFFKRLAEGIFDEEDLIIRTKELNKFLDDASEEYKFDRKNIVAVGYSNGANIAASLLFHYKDTLKGAILLHPMVPRRGMVLPDLKETKVFISAGTNDPICPQQETIELQQLLEGAGASVEMHWENLGHQLTMGEVRASKKWYEQNL